MKGHISGSNNSHLINKTGGAGGQPLQNPPAFSARFKEKKQNQVSKPCRRADSILRLITWYSQGLDLIT